MDAQPRDFIANGAFSAETLVWTEGMTDRQKAGDIPGLLSGTRGSAGIPQPGGAWISAGTPLSIELGLWSFLGGPCCSAWAARC
jgi:hypothetical protein